MLHAIYKYALAVAALAMAAQASAQITFYEHQGFRGASVTVDRPTGDLGRVGFAGAASSAIVAGEAWEVCSGPGFSGRCEVLPPGQHNALGPLNDSILSARPVSARGGPIGGTPQQPGYPAPPVQPPPHAGGQVTFYEGREFRGRSFVADRPIGNLERFGFNDRASSAVVSGSTWEVCDNAGFSGRCAVLRPGEYASLDQMGMNNSISSARPVAEPQPQPGPGAGRATLFEHSNFLGQSITIDRPRRNFERFGFNNAASSVEVVGEPWEFCEGPRFSGRCVVLRPGRYASFGGTGLNDSISSARPARR